MKESDIYLRATNPEQYDLDDLQWDSEAGTEAPRNLFFWDYLKKYSPVWKGKNILDIGAGNGWVLEEAKNAGARSVLGIEPSVRNLELAKKVRPSIPFAHTSLENFDNQGKKFEAFPVIKFFRRAHQT